jgi:tagatose-1,6-bisphosphate aldolase non-catalytic subunit AgaZ/GatZ
MLVADYSPASIEAGQCKLILSASMATRCAEDTCPPAVAATAQRKFKISVTARG